MLGILVDGSPADRATQGQIAEVILAETALYAESGGQVADKGVIVGPGFELEVLDVQKPVAGLVSHTVEVTSGEVGVGQPATTVVDAANRRAARQAHSATHLVHAALRDTLGRTATQAGSLNRAGYMRFDFTWGQSLCPTRRKSEIEEIANNAVRDNLEVTTRVLALDEAKRLGAMALFGEKYGDTVRMVDIGGPWSRELCAGTHVASSAEIGLINLVGESSVGASNRRVEALVGLDAFRSLAAERALVSQLTSTLKTPRDQLPARIAELTAEPQGRREEDRRVRGEGARRPASRPRRERGRRVGAHRVVAESLGHGRIRRRRALARAAGARSPRLGCRASSRSAPRSAGAPSSSSRRTMPRVPPARKAGALAKAAAATLGGGGGGRDDVAQGGGTDAAALPAALTAVKDALGRVSGFRRGSAPRHRRRQGARRGRPVRSRRAARHARRDRARATSGSVAASWPSRRSTRAFEILVGLPLNMRGEDTASTDRCAGVRRGAGGGIRSARSPRRRAPQHGLRARGTARFGQIPAFVS